MKKKSKIFVAGGQKLIGSAIIRQLQKKGYQNILNLSVKEPELTNIRKLSKFFTEYQPEYIFVASGKTGGIQANIDHPAELIYDNLITELNLIELSYRHKVKKLLYLASSCVYPRDCPQPMKEEYLLTGPLEPTNESYAIAKIAGIKLVESYNSQYGTNFISVIPANYFGIGDDFSPGNSHVIGALINKMHQAKINQYESVEIWGTGKARREFVYGDDLGDGCIFTMLNYNAREPINLSGGAELSIKELAEIIKKVVGFKGELVFNTDKPDGMALKSLDSTKIRKLGWRPKISFINGLKDTYSWYKENIK